jgi:hypothetical protein
MRRGNTGSVDDVASTIKFLANVAQQPPQREAMQPRERAEHADHEQQTRHVKRQHQHAERADRANAEAADRERHRAERAGGRKPHDHREDAKQHVRDTVDHFLHPPAGCWARIQCKAEQKGEQQDRQHFAFLERADERLRNHMQRELDESMRLGARRIVREDGRIQMMRIDVHSRARMQRERGGEPENERNDGQTVEDSQRLQNGPADLRAARKRCNAGDDRTEDDRRDHHAYQRDERIAERFERGAELRPHMADGHAERHAKQHLNVKQPQWPGEHHFEVFFAARAVLLRLASRII